jgi:hypothetical protein
MALAQLGIAPDVEMRTARRRNVNFTVLMRELSARIVPVDLEDISTDGCRLSTDEELETATKIWLQIGGVGTKEAWVTRKVGKTYGCEFLSPIQVGVIEDICSAAGHQRRQQRVPRELHFGRASSS